LTTKAEAKNSRTESWTN